ncbi:HET-domain-containing protein [Macroventuria anomochaeta]|uniref:HET-domain-containing protein n=1 Tax=Macroventuria anomochaeta TaxID=301207 RepID=A0ACB6RJD7_9PLEO|nr:HET-domain-containing protein [Macroventuria anomochaeta]KAF2622016.1 HET-domain-containing protein [Macroventuria anomochaeta]
MIGSADHNDAEHWQSFYTRPAWQSGIMDITTRFDIIEHWLDACTAEKHDKHRMCSEILIPGYPSRLLDVAESESSGYIRLVETKDWPDPRPEYTTLSHCWGSLTGPRPLETTSENIHRHEARIMMKDLPQTFRDAVDITRRIRKNFLWIDSLAIVQDDKQNWEFEASHMAAIYQNSFLTIAATAAEHCEVGCSLEPWRINITEGKVRNISRIRDDMPETFEFQARLKRASISWTGRHTFPLHTRGWVLQEAYLSRRILHMTPQRMLWHCRQHFDHEDAVIFDLGYFKTKVDPQKLGFSWEEFQSDNQWGFYSKQWWRMVNNYSKLNFTYISDRLPAMAGIIQFLATKTGDTPLLGLWESRVVQLYRDLAWTCKQPQASRIPGIPTWTWLSSLSEINAAVGTDIPLWDEVRLESCNIDWEGRPYVSKLKRGTLKLKGQIFETTVTANPDFNTAIQNNFRTTILQPSPEDLLHMSVECKAAVQNSYVDFHSDTLENSSANTDAKITYLLLWYTEHHWSDRIEHIVFLALRKEHATQGGIPAI